MSTFISKYKILKKIGEGSFSEVLKCEDRNTKELYAAKILKRSFQNTNDVLYCAEIIAMQKLNRHPNVLYMHEYFFERSSYKLVFVFELMDMSMYEFMKTKKRSLPESKVKWYLYQMLKGLEYLHRHGLFHRDVKPENVLVRIIKEQEELVKIADLGSIRGIYSKHPYTEYISTRWYRSPECLLTIGHYGPKMDVWASGCVFYEMLTMKPLFPGTNEIDQLAKIHSILGTPNMRILGKLKSRSKNFKHFNRQIGSGLGPLISQFSCDAQIILKLMLQYDPDIRSNARRLLQHKYFSCLRDDDRIKKFQKVVIHQDAGDMGLTTKNNQFHSNSLKSFFNHDASKPCLQSITTIELLKQSINEYTAYFQKKNMVSDLEEKLKSKIMSIDSNKLLSLAVKNCKTSCNLVNAEDGSSQTRFQSSCNNIVAKRNASVDRTIPKRAKRPKL